MVWNGSEYGVSYESSRNGQTEIYFSHKLLQVVMNLLDNAIKYAPPGSAVELGAPVESRDRITFTVRDHGPGLGEAPPELLFERYRQGAPSPHASGQGFGLGLYVVKSLLDIMQGEVSARTHPGGGAEFTVTEPNAEGKIGRNDQWLKVEDPTGTEGFVAAWFVAR